MEYSKEDLLETLNIHRGHNNISSTLYEKLKIYIENGGYLDTEDWLFFIEYKFENEEILDIEELQKKRHTLVTFDTKNVLFHLKNAGFFKETNCSDNVLKDKKVKQRQFTEESMLIALQDNTKAILLDLEADVCKENSSYTEYLKDMEELSKQTFKPTEIKETWDSDEGPIEISFVSNGNRYAVNPNYWDDWYDLSEITKKINQSLEINKAGLYTLTSEFTGGQEILLLFLTDEEKLVIERELKWQIVKL
ncbi:hypothetical protein BC781_107245 [Sediminitomix flava]|uniref:Uncharacterized protein n=2 Tax=Sediminitomix flava TaxID=379075 RepID=A0A315ZTT7_SEDFL|nr:hypothetical protein BC781_107245 [Sediminitomix flava]